MWPSGASNSAGGTRPISLCRRRWLNQSTYSVTAYSTWATFGYMLKSCTDDELNAAIRSLATEPGKVVLSVTADLFSTASEEPTAVLLTNRQYQILLLASRALSNRQIASRLGVTEATVKRHLHDAFAKLGATSRIDAVNKAVRLGLITSASTHSK